MDSKELYVGFVSDTEDNHPNYVPGWVGFGSDYNKNPPTLRWSWTQYWSDLSNCFNKNDVPVTWLIRVDDGPVYDQMLIQNKEKILELRSLGDEIGIHVHTWLWNSNLSKWIQTKNPDDEVRIVKKSIKMFKKHLGFNPASARMGWNTMSNEIMRIFNANGFKVDASAIPGTLSQGKFSKRDNIYDWSKTPYNPYHPSFTDYQAEGDMKILEIPLSTLKKKSGNFAKLVNKLSSFPSLSYFLPIARFFNLTPHHHFYISPYWSSSQYDKIIDTYHKQAIKNGLAFLVGYFHGCDILNPLNSKLNLIFQEHIQKIINKINSLNGVEVKFATLCQMADKYVNHDLNKNFR